jgi:hypothetical protein
MHTQPKEACICLLSESKDIVFRTVCAEFLGSSQFAVYKSINSASIKAIVWNTKAHDLDQVESLGPATRLLKSE